MVCAKATAVGIATGLLTSVALVAAAVWPILASTGEVGSIQNFYVVLRPMFILVVIGGFSIGFGWTMWGARPKTRT